MNRYFIFKKVRSLDVKKMSDIILTREKETGDIIDNILENDDESIKSTVQKSKPKITAKKLKKDKIIIQKSNLK